MNKAGQISTESRFLTLAEEFFPGDAGGDDVSSSGRWGREVTVQCQLVPGVPDRLHSIFHLGGRTIFLLSSPVTLKGRGLLA